MAGSDRFEWIDNLRIVATISVILLHVAAFLVEQIQIPEVEWHIGNVVDALMRFSVPVFVMVSGALLLAREDSIEKFLFKRITRVVYPFLFWSVFYISYRILNTPDYTYSLLEVSKSVYMGFAFGASYHLWYVYMILGLYLFIPVIRKWVIHSKESDYIYFLLIWIATLFMSFPYFDTLWPRIELTYFSGFLGYMVLGYYLSNKDFRQPKMTLNLGYVFLLLGWGITAIGTAAIYMTQGEYRDIFYTYLTPNIFLLSAGIFIIFKFQFRKAWTNPFLMLIKKHSYGIYLAHPLVLYFLDSLGLNAQLIHPLLGIILCTVACLILSMGLVWLVSKLPKGKYIAG